MLILVAVVVAWFGFALFALSQQRHWQSVAGAHALSSHRRRCQRAVASMLLTLSLILTLRAEGVGFGGLLWPLLASAAAFSISFTLAWRSSWLQWLVPQGDASKRR